ncbi:tRNA lysidine(34) synthetase TilS [Hydrogenophaga crocea]|uniref:tRNA(Ile)-lysidine synthase n=1 Tax=Hydrogenophaga crocea TaxID=2716225 RepID=A0A6G8IE56_9BURK|nr:tRNA lysidine(34) synthetase TilS [Hydrogenophaga crocea]
MAASPTPRPKRARSADAAEAALPGAQALADWALRHWGPDGVPEGPVAVAFSGGADSTALLLAAHALWPGRVIALHVHHGLQAAADAFEAQVRERCARLGLACHVRRVDARAAPGQSPEDAARGARYAALAALAREAGADWVLLAQHLDDQAETVLLALSRGAGLPGLAAMPEAFVREGVRFGRPWLGLRGQALRDALIERGEAFVDDPSNADLRFTRNRIRHRLSPAWAEAFEGYREALARSAAHAAQAQRLLDELAAIDLAATGTPPRIAALQALSRERQANALRHWLRQAHGVAPSAAQLAELLDQVQACRTRGHAIRLKVAAGVVCREGAQLAYTPSI